MISRTKRLLLATTTLLILVASFWMRSLASWRPVKVGRTSTNKGPIEFLSEDGRTGLSFIYHGDEDDQYGDEITDFQSGRTTAWPDKEAILGFSNTAPGLAILADGERGQIRVRDVRTGRLKQTLPWVRGIFETRFVNTTRASTVAIVGADTFFSWDLNSGKQLIRVSLKNPFTTDDELYTLSPDGTRLVGCCWERGTIWNAQSGQVLKSWTIKGDVHPDLISRDARVLVYNASEIDCYLFVDSSTGKVLWQRQKNGDDRAFPWLGEDDEVLFSTSEQCQVFDLSTGHLKRQLARPREIDGNFVRITHDYIYAVHNSSDTMNSNGEVWRWRAR